MSIPRFPAVDENGEFISETVKEQVRALAREVVPDPKPEVKLVDNGDGTYSFDSSESIVANGDGTYEIGA